MKKKSGGMEKFTRVGQGICQDRNQDRKKLANRLVQIEIENPFQIIH